MLIQAKNVAFNSFRNNSGISEIKRHLVSLQERVKASIESSKQNYHYQIANKLNNTQKNSKYYCLLLKIFLNNKKRPVIPPLFISMTIYHLLSNYLLMTHLCFL